MCICERALWIFPHCHQVTSLAAAVRAPISVHSHQHPTSLLLATHLQLQLLLITVTVIHWIMAHMTLQAYILLVACLLYNELHQTALERRGVGLG